MNTCTLPLFQLLAFFSRLRAMCSKKKHLHLNNPNTLMEFEFYFHFDFCFSDKAAQYIKIEVKFWYSGLGIQFS